MIRRLIARVRILVTGVVEWLDEEGSSTRERVGWRTRWALVGIHSNRWKWVRKYGEMPCGCTRNPITRRRVLTALKCEKHCIWNFLADDEDPFAE